jgi:hypothetical protein
MLFSFILYLSLSDKADNYLKTSIVIMTHNLGSMIDVDKYIGSSAHLGRSARGTGSDRLSRAGAKCWLCQFELLKKS